MSPASASPPYTQIRTCWLRQGNSMTSGIDGLRCLFNVFVVCDPGPQNMLRRESCAYLGRSCTQRVQHYKIDSSKLKTINLPPICRSLHSPRHDRVRCKLVRSMRQP
ncbi:unnamed protein product [Ectocarpus sp. 13 AM-2016]